MKKVLRMYEGISKLSEVGSMEDIQKVLGFLETRDPGYHPLENFLIVEHTRSPREVMVLTNRALGTTGLDPTVIKTLWNVREGLAKAVHSVEMRLEFTRSS